MEEGSSTPCPINFIHVSIAFITCMPNKAVFYRPYFSEYEKHPTITTVRTNTTEPIKTKLGGHHVGPTTTGQCQNLHKYYVLIGCYVCLSHRGWQKGCVSPHERISRLAIVFLFVRKSNSPNRVCYQSKWFSKRYLQHSSLHVVAIPRKPKPLDVKWNF
jgi:hypothetical protein